jgi:hypothetical protein
LLGIVVISGLVKSGEINRFIGFFFVLILVVILLGAAALFLLLTIGAELL